MPSPGSEFGAIGPPWWDDRPVILVGTGPSLAAFDFERLRGLGRVVAIKESIWDLPFAEACVGLDLPWMRRQADRLADVAKTIPLYLGVPKHELPHKHVVIPGAIYLDRRRVGNELSDDPEVIEFGGTSGFGAFNVAYLKRARSIYLFGFDFTTAGGGHYCQSRYGHHPDPHFNQRYWPRWGSNFRSALPQLARAGVTVINASPISTVDAFPKCGIDEALQRLDRLRYPRT